MNNQIKISDSIVNTVPSDNFLFSIIGLENEHFYSLIMNNYINITYNYVSKFNCFHKYFEDSYAWNNFHGLDVIYFSRNYVEKHIKSVLPLFSNLILENYCILTYIDQYYISLYKKNYQKWHISHEIMLYGYDSGTHLFSCKDYFEYGRYSTGVAHEKEIYAAIENYNKTQYPDYSIGIVAIKKQLNFEFIFNPYSLIKELKKLHNNKFNMQNISYGIGIFDAMKITLENDSPIWRPESLRTFFHFIHDNVNLMSYRIQYLNTIKPHECLKGLLEKCKAIQKQCILYRNKFLKIELTEAKNSLCIKKRPQHLEYTSFLDGLKAEYLSLIDGLIKYCETVFC